MELKEMFKYRNIWMAIAIIFIFFFHLEYIPNNIILNHIKSLGYGGVDIFLFASGIGCYLSLQKNNNIASFIKKRVLKIIPTYWIFLIFYFIFKYTTDDITLSMIIGNLFCIQSIIGLGKDFNWYMSAMWIFYFMTPYFAKIIDKIDSWKQLTTIILLFILFSFAFWDTENLIIIVTRIPIFLIGMYMAKKSIFPKKKINKEESIIFIFLLVIGFSMLSYFKYSLTEKLWTHGLHWYPFILITPGLCYIISIISKNIEKNNIGKLVLRFLHFIGKNTFEIYLVHILMISIVSKFFININAHIKCILVIILTIAGCIVLKQLTKIAILILKKIFFYRKEKNVEKCRKNN